MRTITNITSVDTAQLLAPQVPNFKSWLPKTATRCEIQASISRPKFNLDVKHYFWDKPLKPTWFEHPHCYLELSLGPRPRGTDINYSGLSSTEAFVPTGTCSFVPAGYKAMVRCPQGDQHVMSCIFGADSFAEYVDWEWNPEVLAACHDISSISVRNTLALLSQEVLNPGYKSEQCVDALFQFLLIELSRHIRAIAINNDSDSGKLSVAKIRQIETRLAEATVSFPKTADIAKECGVSTRHLARLFRQTTGKTLTEASIEIRINRAKIELSSGVRLVKEIAYDCGFQTQSSFAQAFKKATGQTPRQFRNAANRNN